MAVYKYKTFDEAEKALWNFHPDEKYLEGVAKFWDFANRLSSIKYPRGVFKYKDIKQADEQMNLLRSDYISSICREDKSTNS
jgi:hypothetical protein